MLAGVVITVLLGLSMILLVSTVFSNVSTALLQAILALFFLVGIVVGTLLARRSRGRGTPPRCSGDSGRTHWLECHRLHLLRPMVMAAEASAYCCRASSATIIVSVALPDREVDRERPRTLSERARLRSAPRTGSVCGCLPQR